MAQVALAYGPPAHRGVTTLMSVGADEASSPLPIETYVQRGLLAAIGLFIAGSLMRNTKMKSLGLGATLGLGAVQILTSRKP